MVVNLIEHNILLKYDPERLYSNVGRIHNQTESLEIERYLTEYLTYFKNKNINKEFFNSFVYDKIKEYKTNIECY